MAIYNTVLLSLVLQNDNKVLTIQDISKPTESPWGVMANFDKFFNSDNPDHALTDIYIKVTIETKDKTYDAVFDNDAFDMVTSGNTHEIGVQDQIYFNVAKIDDVLVPVPYGSTDSTGFEGLPDGIYTVEYILTLDVDSWQIIDEYVLTYKADEVIKKKTDEVDAAMYTCPNYTLADSLDYLAYRTMHLSLTDSRLIANRTAILNTLDHIGNEDFEYYTT